MDVRISLSVSLRDQLGTVIEQAVTNAVETVLQEMLKVVGCKFEEFSKEMTAKERENESIRKMLEISRCQMRTMRKYLSAVSAKDERHVPVNQKFGKQSETIRTLCHYGGELQAVPIINRTRKGGDGNFTVNGRTERSLSDNHIASLPEGSTRASQLRDGTATKDQEHATAECQDLYGSDPNVHQNLTPVKEEHSDPLERPGGCHTREGICETEPSLEGATEMLGFDDPSLHKPDDIAAAAADGASPHAKVEEAEISIKEEPPELEVHTLSPRPPDHLGDHRHEQTSGQDRTFPADGLMGTALPAMSSSTCWVGRQQPQGGSDPQSLRRQRAELQRRSQLRRREREKSLPPPLQAALERERREKTRIRVARWRAKRKMQAAGLLPTDGRRAHDAPRCPPRFGALLFGGPRYDNAAPYPPPQAGHGLADSLLQPEATVLQRAVLGTDSELFQSPGFEG